MKQRINKQQAIKTFLLPLISFSLMGCGGDSTTSGSKDTTPPQITLKGNTNISVTIGNTYGDAGATASDDVDGDISGNIVIGGDTVDTKKIGKYTITYDVSDKAKNKATQVRRIVHITAPWEHGNLKVKETMLQHEDGTGFFWMADTAWNLYLKSEKDIDLYLTDRAKKKFTVIQAVAMHSHWSHTGGDVNGIYPYEGGKHPNAEGATPNETYWKHIDYMISKAEEKGLYVALLPVWHHAIIDKTFTEPKDASKFGKWIANRYKDRKNIIWVVGGDTRANATRAAENMTAAQEVAIWNALGSTLKSVDANHLITFHPLRIIPSKVFSKPKWLAFNMLQSARETTIDAITQVQDAMKEKLPVVDGESLYENFGEVAKGGEADRRTPYQVRDDAYSQLFAGAFGNTYGHGSIFQFWEETIPAVCTGWNCTPNMTWKQALNAPGGVQMQYVTELMQSRPIVGRVSDQSLIVGTPKATAYAGIVATKGVGYAMIYTAHGEDINVQLGKVSGTEVKAWWYNPRDGKSIEIGEFENSGTHIFETPGEPTAKPTTYGDLTIRDGNDWILVLDDKSKGFLAPGK